MADIRKFFYFPFSFINVAVILYLNQVALCEDQKHIIAKRFIFSQSTSRNPGPQKNYTGITVSKNSTKLIYYYEQTIAVLEVEEESTLVNCELLEVRTASDKEETLKALKETISRQSKINFFDMNDLMHQCQDLNIFSIANEETEAEEVIESITYDSKTITSIFKGVFPGTKWCGAGDLAANYYDVGVQVEVDKCCRTHDYCPVKVLAFQKLYDLVNYAPYTKSHCECDKRFYQCLKSVKNNLSNLIGTLYFNVARPLCIEDVLTEDKVLQKKFVSNIIPF